MPSVNQEMLRLSVGHNGLHEQPLEAWEKAAQIMGTSLDFAQQPMSHAHPVPEINKQPYDTSKVERPHRIDPVKYKQIISANLQRGNWQKIDQGDERKVIVFKQGKPVSYPLRQKLPPSAGIVVQTRAK